MVFDIEERHLGIVKKILKELVPESTVYVFGSRAKGDAKPYSDLDLAIDLKGKKLDLSMLAKLNSAFEETTIPYKIDIVDLKSISNEFKNNIKADLVKLVF